MLVRYAIMTIYGYSRGNGTKFALYPYRLRSSDSLGLELLDPAQNRRYR